MRYLTPLERARLDTLLQIQRPSISLTDFKFKLYHRYQHPPHLALLDDYLMQVTRYVETGGAEGIGRLIIEMPPRHGKTVTTSRLYPVWHLGRNPDHRIMLVSYGATLAHKNSRLARNLVRSQLYGSLFPNVRLAKDSQSSENWDIEDHDGGVDALGVMGGATGKGAHLLIIDDPVKNREEAESEIIREKTWDGFADDLFTRLEPGGAVIIMATRWHLDDLIGRVLKNFPDEYTRLRLPALAEDHDPLKRKEGAALWEARYPLKSLQDIQRILGEYSFSALYQQNPIPLEGGLFKRRYFEPAVSAPPEIVHAARYWDLAMSDKTSADYTAGVKIGQATDGHYYILDVARGQIDWGDVTDFMASVMLADGADVIQGVEEKGYMSRAVQELNRDPRLNQHQVWGYPVDRDKVTRALPFAAKCAAGVVHVVNAHWTQSYVEELCTFPNGAHDDQVDASSGAWTMVSGGDAAQSGDMQYADEYAIGGADY